MHVDESQLSLTLALNELHNYAGGGTYVAELRRALRPELGHMVRFAVSFRGLPYSTPSPNLDPDPDPDQVSFEGGVFHGGEPIVRGTRHIIAAFLYLDETCDAAAATTAAADVAMTPAAEPPAAAEADNDADADARIVAATLRELRPPAAASLAPPTADELQSKRARLGGGPLAQAFDAGAEATAFSFGF